MWISFQLLFTNLVLMLAIRCLTKFGWCVPSGMYAPGSKSCVHSPIILAGVVSDRWWPLHQLFQCGFLPQHRGRRVKTHNMVPNKWIMHPVLHKSPPRSFLGIRLRLSKFSFNFYEKFSEIWRQMLALNAGQINYCLGALAYTFKTL